MGFLNKLDEPPVRKDRKHCANCGASAAGCQSNEWLRGRRSLPGVQGRPRRRGQAVTSKPDTPCIRCGRLLWSSARSAPPELRVCRPCRRRRRAGYGPPRTPLLKRKGEQDAQG